MRFPIVLLTIALSATPTLAQTASPAMTAWIGERAARMSDLMLDIGVSDKSLDQGIETDLMNNIQLKMIFTVESKEIPVNGLAVVRRSADAKLKQYPVVNVQLCAFFYQRELADIAYIGIVTRTVE